MTTPFTYADQKVECEKQEYFQLFMKKLRALLEGARECCVTEIEVRFSQGEAFAYKRVLETWDALIDDIKRTSQNKEK